MSLFDDFFSSPINILPKDGIVEYYGKIYSPKESDFFYNKLLTTIQWENDEAIIFGKLISTKRKVAWFGNQKFEYT